MGAADCDFLDTSPECNGDLLEHTEGVCVSGTCSPTTVLDQDCGAATTAPMCSPLAQQIEHTRGFCDSDACMTETVVDAICPGAMCIAGDPPSHVPGETCVGGGGPPMCLPGGPTASCNPSPVLECRNRSEVIRNVGTCAPDTGCGQTGSVEFDCDNQAGTQCSASFTMTVDYNCRCDTGAGVSPPCSCDRDAVPCNPGVLYSQCLDPSRLLTCAATGQCIGTVGGPGVCAGCSVLLCPPGAPCGSNGGPPACGG